MYDPWGLQLSNEFKNTRRIGACNVRNSAIRTIGASEATEYQVHPL